MENNNNIEKQREEFLKKLDAQEKELDMQLNSSISLKNKKNQTVNPPLPDNKELSLEERQKRFLDDLDKKDKELDAMKDSTASAFTKRKTFSSQEIMKANFYKTIIGAAILFVVIIIISKSFLAVKYESNASATMSNNTNQVKIALINYYKNNKRLPVNNDNLIDTQELIRTQYLGTPVEEQCNCKFYLKDDKQTVIAIPNKSN